MNSLIDIFRMSEIDRKIRARVIIRMGKCLNNQVGCNITEPLVFELVRLLDPENEILINETFLKLVNR